MLAGEFGGAVGEDDPDGWVPGPLSVGGARMGSGWLAGPRGWAGWLGFGPVGLAYLFFFVLFFFLFCFVFSICF